MPKVAAEIHKRRDPDDSNPGFANTIIDIREQDAEYELNYFFRKYSPSINYSEGDQLTFATHYRYEVIQTIIHDQPAITNVYDWRQGDAKLELGAQIQGGVAVINHFSRLQNTNFRGNQTQLSGGHEFRYLEASLIAA